MAPQVIQKGPPSEQFSHIIHPGWPLKAPPLRQRSPNGPERCKNRTLRPQQTPHPCKVLKPTAPTYSMAWYPGLYLVIYNKPGVDTENELDCFICCERSRFLWNQCSVPRPTHPMGHHVFPMVPVGSTGTIPRFLDTF